jgi:N-acetylmuramic acid 6-phosphate etherase
MDVLPTLELLEILNDEDERVPAAVRAALPALADAVDRAADRFETGGRIHYVGAGTSGRIAVQDAAELIPTFGIQPDRIVAHIAGGQEALVQPVEGAEDDPETALRDVELTTSDVVLGLSASGTTPYVDGAIRRARQAGALTILITANGDAELVRVVDVPIVVATGPEALAGSTRLKAGSAQKMALNSFSTALMTRVGRTWSNLMVSMAASNDKLRSRAVAVISAIAGVDGQVAADALLRCDYRLGVAVVHVAGGIDPDGAAEVLERSGGSVRRAIDMLTEA